MTVIETTKKSFAESNLYGMSLPHSFGGVGRTIARFFWAAGEGVSYLMRPRKHLEKAVLGDEPSMHSYLDTRSVIFRYLPACVQRACLNVAEKAMKAAFADWQKASSRMGERSVSNFIPEGSVFNRHAAKGATGNLSKQVFLSGHDLGKLGVLFQIDLNRAMNYREALSQPPAPGSLTQQEATVVKKVHGRPDMPIKLPVPDFSITDKIMHKTARPAAKEMVGLMIRGTMLADYLHVKGIDVTDNHLMRLVSPERDPWVMLRSNDVQGIIRLDAHLKEKLPESNKYDRAFFLDHHCRGRDPVADFDAAQEALVARFARKVAGRRAELPEIRSADTSTQTDSKRARREAIVSALSKKDLPDWISSTQLKLHARYIDNLSARRGMPLRDVLDLVEAAAHPAEVLGMLRSTTIDGLTRADVRPTVEPAKPPPAIDRPSVVTVDAPEKATSEERRQLRVALHQFGEISFHEFRKMLERWSVRHTDQGVGSHGSFERKMPDGTTRSKWTTHDLRTGGVKISQSIIMEYLEHFDISLADFAEMLRAR